MRDPLVHLVCAAGRLCGEPITAAGRAQLATVMAAMAPYEALAQVLRDAVAATPDGGQLPEAYGARLKALISELAGRKPAVQAPEPDWHPITGTTHAARSATVEE